MPASSIASTRAGLNLSFRKCSRIESANRCFEEYEQLRAHSQADETALLEALRGLPELSPLRTTFAGLLKGASVASGTARRAHTRRAGAAVAATSRKT